jgi:transposase-like protein
MKRICPNPTCKSLQIIKDGSYKRKNDSRTIQRFKCKSCYKKFSSSTGTLEFGQKKRRVNYPLFKLLASGVSLRKSALILGVHKETVRRKLIYLGKKSKLKNDRFLKRLQKDKCSHMQFDDLITKENTKLKPLSISVAVDFDRRYILGAKVSQIPAFGHLAKIAKKKYGYRKSYHKKALDELFDSIKGTIGTKARIDSDEHKFYKAAVQKYFKESIYKQFKSETSTIAGQGELKRVYFDPLFKINHTLAMLRANINRLMRRTWCTTKDPIRLSDHLELFIYYYNQIYLKKLAPR